MFCLVEGQLDPSKYMWFTDRSTEDVTNDRISSHCETFDCSGPQSCVKCVLIFRTVDMNDNAVYRLTPVRAASGHCPSGNISLTVTGKVASW